MVTHPRQTIIDKNIRERLSTAYLKEATGTTPQTLVVENQHINPPEEPELMANADYDAPKKPVSVFFLYFKPLPKATQCEKKKKKEKSELKHSYKHTDQRNVRTKGKAEGRTKNFKKTEKLMKLKRDFIDN
ncbi:UNVERIFIED_CONTAM: hypothetical protein NCL1_22342 [Trichonephila clavipes]